MPVEEINNFYAHTGFSLSLAGLGETHTIFGISASLSQLEVSEDHGISIKIIGGGKSPALLPRWAPGW